METENDNLPHDVGRMMRSRNFVVASVFERSSVAGKRLVVSAAPRKVDVKHNNK